MSLLKTANQNVFSIPVNDIDTLYLFGEVELNTKLLNFFCQQNIMIYFFNYYGFYSGSFYPREFLSAGEIIVRQSEHYLKKNKRLQIAKEFVKGAAYGTIQNLILNFIPKKSIFTPCRASK